MTLYFISYVHPVCIWKARKAEEQRAQRMAAEMNQYRHDMERRLTEKEEELECVK